MKLNEAISIPLMENPRDQYALENIAEVAYQHYINLSGGVNGSPDGSRYVFPLSDVRGLSHLYPRLRTIDAAFIHQAPRGLSGSYNSALNTIRIFVHGQSEEEIKSTLVHELRHALDSSYSKRQYMDKSREYLSSQHEVNARFSQAMKELNQMLFQSIRENDPMSPYEYLETFERLAIKYQLISVFADPSQSEAAEWLSKMDSRGNISVYGRDTNAELIVTHYTGSSRLTDAITDRKRYNRLLTRVYKSYEYNMEKYG